MAVKVSRTTQQEAKEMLWRKGTLIWKLDKGQIDLYNLFHNSEFKTQTWLISRRYGKTYTLCVLALEACLRKPNTIVKFASPTKIQVNNNVRPLFRDLLIDCPEDLKPEFKEKDYIYYFHNGSEIQLAGTESGHAEKLRGGGAYIAIVDEAQDCSDLTNLVKSIMLPTTLTTKGKVLLSGTPPKESDHEFINFIEEAEVRGSLIKKSINENTRLTQKEKDDFIEELGGRTSDSVRRELFCELIKDEKGSVIPEFTTDLEKEIVKDWPLPAHFDSYVALDPGMKDLTGLVFGYYDFRADKIIIQDEICMDLRIKENNLTKLTQDILTKEKSLWFNHVTNEMRPVYKRVSDNDLIVINELNSLSDYKLRFQPTDKRDLQTAINRLRELIKSKKIIIHPRCTTLIRHLRNVRWKPGQKNEFARSADDGHYDLAAACIYLVRNVDIRRNPYPAHYGMDMKDLFYQDKKNFESKNTLTESKVQTYNRIFNIKGKK